jgi:hypothetical protein
VSGRTKHPDEVVARLKVAAPLINGKFLSAVAKLHRNTIHGYANGLWRADVKPDPDFRKKLEALILLG